MNQTDIPARFPIPFASGASTAYIRPIPKDHVAASTDDAPASLHDGFPAETFSPLGSGGIPPNGKDFNGILNQITAWALWQAAGGPAVYDATFSAAIGGYPKGAQLASTTIPGVIWVSLVDGNTTDPDGGGAANWARPAKLMQDGTVSATVRAGTSGSVTFPIAFPNSCTSVSFTGINSSASAARDNWIQIVSRTRTGFSYCVQGTVTGGDDTLDGFDWQAWGQ